MTMVYDITVALLDGQVDTKDACGSEDDDKSIEELCNNISFVDGRFGICGVEGAETSMVVNLLPVGLIWDSGFSSSPIATPTS
jgi:hypothetical protein